MKFTLKVRDLDWFLGSAFTFLLRTYYTTFYFFSRAPDVDGGPFNDCDSILVDRAERRGEGASVRVLS